MLAHFDLAMARVERLRTACDTEYLDLGSLTADLYYQHALSLAEVERWEDAYQQAGQAIQLMEAHLAVQPYSAGWLSWKRDLLHEKYAEYREKSGH